MIQPGDHVKYAKDESEFVSRIIAIEEEWAWCRSIIGGDPFTVKLSSLKLVDRDGT